MEKFVDLKDKKNVNLALMYLSWFTVCLARYAQHPFKIDKPDLIDHVIEILAIFACGLTFDKLNPKFVVSTALIGTSICMLMPSYKAPNFHTIMLINPFISESVDQKSHGLAVAGLMVIEALTSLIWMPGRFFISILALFVGILVFFFYDPKKKQQ